tara:strand:+ start:191 stop:1540 length:1350 start_codon:yes stop_codon:yes gene_type:complete
MKSRLNPPYLRDISLRSLNEAIIEIYRALNIISDSADEVTFRKAKNGSKELVINDNGKKYIDTSKNASFDANLRALKTKTKNDLKKELSLDKVTNESKATILHNPTITGAADGSEGKPVINTETSNKVILAFNENDEDFYLKLIGSGGAYDNGIQFFTGASAKWAMGYVQDSPTIFRINAGANLNADVVQLTDAGNLTIDGDLSVNGGDATVTAGSSENANFNLISNASAVNGNDWTIRSTVVSQTLTFINDKSGSGVAQFQITPHATVASGTSTFYTQLKVNTETAAGSETGKIAVLDSGVIKYRTPAQILTETGANQHFMTHNCDYTGTASMFLPFGGSQTELSSMVAGAGQMDHVWFIAPVAGKLIKLMFQSASAAGSTTAQINVNGSDQANMTSGVTCSATTTTTLTLNTSGNSFAAGDVVKIKLNPTNAPDEMAITSVWEFDKI